MPLKKAHDRMYDPSGNYWRDQKINFISLKKNLIQSMITISFCETKLISKKFFHIHVGTS
jgi:hypothetical protein